MTFKCDAIRRRSMMFYSFLARLDARFIPLIFELEDALAKKGVDYSQYLTNMGYKHGFVIEYANQGSRINCHKCIY